MGRIMPDIEWEPYTSSGGVLRVTHTSCCGLFEWAAEGGRFFVLRRTSGGGYEETGRGLHHQAIEVYKALVQDHHAWHRRRGERPEPDTFLPRERTA
jgi:hypothetical protein